MKDSQKLPGHWLLAKMWKRVLRPGGKEMTLKMLEYLDIGSQDDVIEFAPWIWWTAEKSLAKNPKSYTGVELDEKASKELQKKFNFQWVKIIQANARETWLSWESATKLYGEAMLSMQPTKLKQEIIQESLRLLKKGGLYGIHELALVPDSIDEDLHKQIQRDLSETIRVNVSILTQKQWKDILESNGFKVKEIYINPMHLLEPKRVVSDEWFFRTIKIVFNVLTHPSARKRILRMKKLFKKYEKSMRAIMIVVEKI